jgi:aminoglycoside phosphotransferase (APT) family kinase protein
MTETVTPTTPEQLAAALQRVWPGARNVHVEAIPESHSGFTYMVDAELEGRQVGGVLRLPPPGARPLGPADVMRQARIMSALAEAGLPMAAILASSEEPVLDGRPFVLMEKVDGVRIEKAVETAEPRDLVNKAFATARAMHAVPAAATGIGGEESYGPAEEVARWQALRARAPEEYVKRAPELEARLLAALPARREPSLVHGDYHLGNLLFRGGEVVAVLDWEIAEVGQAPLDEAALCLVAIRMRFGEPQPGAEAALPLAEMIELAGAGPDFDWFLAATCHKYGAILAYNLGLHRRGKRIDPIYEELLKTIPGLFDAGLEILG